MSWFLFDERGERARWVPAAFWVRVERGDHRYQGCGFNPPRLWRPTYFAARMAKGYRVFELDVGVHKHVDRRQLTDWWQPASPDHRRFPTLAAVEMFLRMKA